MLAYRVALQISRPAVGFFRIFRSNLVPFGRGEDAGIQAILTLSHLHAGGSLPRVGLTPVTENPHSTAFSNRRIGDGCGKATIWRDYAFGMVMYWVCAGLSAVG